MAEENNDYDMSSALPGTGHAGRFSFWGDLLLALLIVAGFSGICYAVMRGVVNSSVEASWRGKTTAQLEASWGAPQEKITDRQALRMNGKSCAQFDPADTPVHEALVYHLVPGTTYRSADGRKTSTCPAYGKTQANITFFTDVNGKIIGLAKQYQGCVDQ